MVLGEAGGNVRGPKGINRVHLADGTRSCETRHEGDVVSHTLAAKLGEGSEIGHPLRGGWIRQSPAQHGLVGLDHVVERATPPYLGVCTLSGASVLQYLGLPRSAAPAEGSAFVDGMESVD